MPTTIASPTANPTLPWQPTTTPLMLAPMQGLTNSALRSLLIEWVRPDVVFSEFIRIAGGKRQALRPAMLQDITAPDGGVPLVVQLIGQQPALLVDAALALQDAGVRHINLNLGCPYGRTTSSAVGGELLRHPAQALTIVDALRRAVTGSFSIKLRAGYDRPQQLLELLPQLEDAGVDFLIVHPRTVVQEYRDAADHAVTAAAVRRSRLPIIANGDIVATDQARQLLAATGAAGLMLGRGALADPLLFERLRQRTPAVASAEEQRQLVGRLLRQLLPRYQQRYCGQAQVLAKLRSLLPYLRASGGEVVLEQLKKTKTVATFEKILDRLEHS